MAIGDIRLDPKSRDDIPAVLKGLQYLHVERRGELPGRIGGALEAVELKLTTRD